MSQIIVAVDPEGVEAGVFSIGAGESDLEDDAVYDFVWPNGMQKQYRIQKVGTHDGVGGQVPHMARYNAATGQIRIES